MRGREKHQLSDCCQLSLCLCNGGGDNLAQNQPLMPLKCQRLQKGRETAKIESTFIFQYGRCYNALMPLSECTQGHQEREKRKADTKKTGNEKEKKGLCSSDGSSPI